MKQILISEDRNKAIRVINELQEKCDKANGAIPALFKANDIPLTEENFRLAIFSPRQIEKVYNDILNEKIKSFPQVIQATARNEAEFAVENILKELGKLEFSYQEKPFITLFGTSCKVNEEAIKESCKHYLTDAKEIEVYNNVKQAADALNLLFNGNIPVTWWSVFQAKDGLFVVNESLNFGYLANKK